MTTTQTPPGYSFPDPEPTTLAGWEREFDAFCAARGTVPDPFERRTVAAMCALGDRAIELFHRFIKARRELNEYLASLAAESNPPTGPSGGAEPRR